MYTEHTHVQGQVCQKKHTPNPKIEYTGIMAMAKLSDGVIEIEGKFGGSIFRKDQCGQHIQAYGRDIDSEPTLKQVTRRNAFARIMHYIPSHATVWFVQSWSQYAYEHPKKNKKGETYFLDWWQIFLSFNINSVIEGNPIQQLPPGYPPEP